MISDSRNLRFRYQNTGGSANCYSSWTSITSPILGCVTSENERDVWTDQSKHEPYLDALRAPKQISSIHNKFSNSKIIPRCSLGIKSAV